MGRFGGCEGWEGLGGVRGGKFKGCGGVRGVGGCRG